MIDFSKAFDFVDHDILMCKIAKLNMPSNFFNWVKSFLFGCSQVTRIGGQVSGLCNINRGIVQGSVLGPVLFTIMLSDLRTISLINLLFKFADDTNLLVPENSPVDLRDEFENIKQWSLDNKMALNFVKTKEIVFHRPSPRNFIPPAPLQGIVQIEEGVLLGVTFSSLLNFENHVNFVLRIAGQRLYPLRLLRDQGLPVRERTIIFKANILSLVMYAAPAWGGFLSTHLINKMNAFFRRSYPWGIISEALEFEDLLIMADHELFSKIQLKAHHL